MNGLILHCGANRIDEQQMRSTPTPQATKSWCPIPHATLFDTVSNALMTGGAIVGSVEHSLTKGGNRYFALANISHPNDTDYSLAVAIRNSHDKSFPAGLALGNRVFVCDNLSFSGEVAISRKHTTFINRDLVRLVATAVGRLAQKRQEMDQRVLTYKGTELEDRDVSHTIVHALRANVLTTRQIEPVLAEYAKPQHEEFGPRTLWSLFNSVTEVLKTLENADTLLQRTQRLYGVCDTFARPLTVDATSVATNYINTAL